MRSYELLVSTSFENYTMICAASFFHVLKVTNIILDVIRLRTYCTDDIVVFRLVEIRCS